MKNIYRALAGAAIGAGMAVALAPIASATDPAYPNDPYGFHDLVDRTDYLVPIQDPIAAFGAQSNKPIIVSPFGNTHKIECRGDGHYVAIQLCRQYDDNNQPHDLNPAGIFGRQVWFY